jgi:choline dehydrogenase-like flavoprotein
VTASSLQTGAFKTFTASRIFIGTGAVASTGIVMRSQPAFSPLPFEENLYLQIPVILHESWERIYSENLHTLSQYFYEVESPILSSSPVHLQLYTYNDFYRQLVVQKIGPLAGLLPKLTERLISRLGLIQGFFHSRHGPKLSPLKRHTSTGFSVCVQSPADKTDNKKLRTFLAKHSRYLGFTPIPFAGGVMMPGKSFHIGGSLAMGHITDKLGRLAGTKNIHVIDGSILPQVPAATITFSIMANAHRIASNV